MKILITGGAGFIGSHLANHLSRKKLINVHVCDNLITGNLNNLENDRIVFHKIDVNNFNEISKIMIKYNFDYIYHYAAIVGVKRTLDNPDLVLSDLDGFKNIFDLSIKTNVKKIFFSSSSEVYGEPVHLPQHENTTPLNSRLPYAVVKNVGECFCRTYFQKFNLDYNIFRFFNTYGANQSNDFVVSLFIKNALKNKDINIYGDGSQTRTFCFIDDNIEATTNSLLENNFNNRTINIGNDKVYSVKELANIIIKLTGSSSKINFLPPLEEGDMSRRQPDVKNMKLLLSNDFVELENGLGLLLKNY